MTFAKWLEYVLGAPLHPPPSIPADIQELDNDALGYIRGEIDSLRRESTEMEQRLVALERKQQHNQDWLTDRPGKGQPEKGKRPT
jgi:hypothetical protein